jgi:hypothetical protein
MEQPQGFNDNSGNVCRLIKSLYGLKQSPRCWNSKIDQFLLNNGWTVSQADPCLYVRSKPRMFLALYVDDGLLFYGEANACSAFELQLTRRFESTFGPADVFLGIEIDRLHDGSFRLHQTGYANRIIERFNLQDAKPVNSPCVSEDISVDSLKPVEINTPFREAIGALLYLSLGTRPDISFAVNVVSRSMTAPAVKDWSAVKRIIRYIKGTLGLGPVYRRPNTPVNPMIRCYSDADYAGCSNTRRSTTGIVLLLAGNPVIWSSRRQPIVALSTTEAEFIAASAGVKEVMWTKLLAVDLGLPDSTPELLIDNRSTLAVLHDPTLHQRTKHIDIRYKSIREHITKKRLTASFVPTDEQLADFLTKALTGPVLHRVLTMLGFHG